MDTYKNLNGFDYMPHYQHYAAVLEAGGWQLSSPEQRYLIDVIRKETAIPAKKINQGHGRRSTKHNIVQPPTPGSQPATPRRNEISQYCSLRITSQEEDLLRSLLGDRDRVVERASSPSIQSPAPARSGHSTSAKEVQESVSTGHAAILIPFSDDEEDQKPYIKEDDDEDER